MLKEQIEYGISFLLFGDNNNRATVEMDQYGKFVITVDLHGCSVRQAKKIINGIIALIREPFTFAIIHGYIHGMAIKEYIHNEFCNTRVVEKYCFSHNPGETFLTVN